MREVGRNESGQAMLLVVGFALVLFAVAGVAVDGARLFVLMQGLQHTADAASLAAANELDVDRFYAGGGAATTIDRDRAIRTAHSIVKDRGLATHLDVQVRGTGVRAIVRSSLDTSFLSLAGIEKLPVAAEATAIPVLGQ